MIVVSDTGPLNYLVLIGHLEALPKLYEVVVIPKAVASELSRPSCPETVRALIESPPVWLKIDQAPEPDPDLSALGDGEQPAIALARTLHADLLLCDDRDARDAALRKNLRVIGGVQFANLPACGYPLLLKPNVSLGWVRAGFRQGGASLEFRGVTARERDHGTTLDLPWRGDA